MHLLSRPRRPRRESEWSTGKAVAFIVTLAATRSVTLAAQSAGMSRKSAYALRGRDLAFSKAWGMALKTRSLAASRKGKVEEVEAAPVSSSQGNSATRARPSTSSSTKPQIKSPNRHAELVSASMNTAESRPRNMVLMDSDLRQNDELKLQREQLLRDRFFARLAARPNAQ